MRWAIFWVLALLALLFNLFSLYDLWMTLTRDAAYLEAFPPEMMAMIDAFPEWRRMLWVVSVFMGIFAALLLLLRRAMAERVFWAVAVFMAIGLIGYDLPFGGGMEGYGSEGLAVSVVIIAIQAGFALYARWAARHGMLR